MGAVCDLLARLQHGHAPDKRVCESSTLLKSIFTRVVYYVSHVIEEKKGTRTIHGGPALKHMLKALDEKSAAGPITLKDLRSVHCFSFLLDEGDKEVVKRLTDKALAKAGGGSVKRSAASSSSSAPAKKKAAK